MNMNCDYFKDCYDKISLLDDELNANLISAEQHTKRSNSIKAAYQIGKNMGLEKQWLQWLIRNTSPSNHDINRYAERIGKITEAENELDKVIGLKVTSVDYGEGAITGRRGDLITVEFADANKSVTYKWDTAIRSGTLRITGDGNVAGTDVENEEVTAMKPEKETNRDQLYDTNKFSESFNDYLGIIDTALGSGMKDTIFNIVPVIRCDDDSEYTDMLEEISRKVFNSRITDKIVQNAIINGARRQDNNTCKIFDNLYNSDEEINSIDISSFSVINPIFTEILQTIRKKMTDSNTVFCIRVSERNSSAAGIIGDKVPVVEICARKPSVEEYMFRLVEKIRPSNRAPLTSEFKTALKNILEKEIYSGSWCGEKSLNFLLLRIMQYADMKCGNQHEKSAVISAAILKGFYHENYNTSDESSLDKLRNMIGMENVVDLAEQLIAKEYQNKLLREKGLKPTLSQSSRNIVFTGPSGCGKTTAAHMLSQILTEEGICTGYHSCNSREIVDRYVGGTKFNTMAAIESAGNGVLFLDEAYALTNGGKNDFGAEAISTLLTAMENPDSQLTIIFAGYKKEMEEFLSSNPGLKSRIGYTVDFRAFSRQDLFEITMQFLENYKISGRAVQLIRNHFYELPQELIDAPNFGLGRYSRNVSMTISSVSARRHWKNDDRSTDISADDVRNALAKIDNKKEPSAAVDLSA